MTRVAPRESPLFAHPELRQRNPAPEPQLLQQVADVQATLVEQHDQPVAAIPREPVKREALQDSLAGHAEAVVRESPPGPALTASPAAPTVSSTSVSRVAPASVIHQEEISPEDLAPAWRSLTPVSKPTQGGHDHATVPTTAEAPPQPSVAPAVVSVPAKASSVPSGAKADNAWLAESLGRRIREVTRYPSSAHLNGWEGKMVLRVIIRSDGHLVEATVYRSSGPEVLDRAALETIRLACPIHMKQALSAEQVAIYVPIVYSLAG